MNSPEQLIKEIKQIADQYHAEVSTSRKRWPKSVQDRVRALFMTEISTEDVATQLPIARATLFKWRRMWGLKEKRNKT